MSATTIRSAQILDGGVTRADVNTATAGSALITKIINSTGVGMSYTGADAGTGDVTLSVNANTTVQKLEVADGGTLIGTRKRLNIIDGTNMASSVADDNTNDKVDLTLATVSTPSFTAVSIPGGTITTDIKQIDLSVTWNNGAVAFTAMKLNVGGTSAAASKALDIQISSVSHVYVDKAGGFFLPDLGVGGAVYVGTSGVLASTNTGGGGVYLLSNKIGFSGTSPTYTIDLTDTTFTLLRVKNTTNAGANNSWVVIDVGNAGSESALYFTAVATHKWKIARLATSNNIVLNDVTNSRDVITAIQAGDLTLNPAGAVMLSSALKATTDNTVDIGAAGANRFKDLYLAGNANVAGTSTLTGIVGVGQAPVAGIPLTILQGTLGNEILRMLSTSTGDDPVESIYMGRVATTDATVTTIFTSTPADNFTVSYEAHITARRTGGAGGAVNDCAAYIVTAVVKRTSGTLTVVGTTTTVIGESQAGWNADAAASGGSIIFRVTGAAGNSVTWHAVIRTHWMNA